MQINSLQLKSHSCTHNGHNDSMNGNNNNKSAKLMG